MQGERPSPPQGIAGYALALVILAIPVLIGVLLFVLEPANGYFWAMIDTGLFALILGLVVYLTSSLARGTTLRLASTGCFWFGVAMLFGADLLTPDSAFGGSAGSLTFTVARVPLLIVILAIVAVGIGIQMWHTSTKRTDDEREAKREEWRRSTQVAAPGQERR